MVFKIAVLCVNPIGYSASVELSFRITALTIQRACANYYPASRTQSSHCPIDCFYRCTTAYLLTSHCPARDRCNNNSVSMYFLFSISVGIVFQHCSYHSPSVYQIDQINQIKSTKSNQIRIKSNKISSNPSQIK